MNDNQLSSVGFVKLAAAANGNLGADDVTVPAALLRQALDDLHRLNGVAGWYDAGLDVWRLWERYTNARTPIDAASELIEPNNAMSALATFLPGYDYETGTIPEEEQ